jgi:PAS domain S-box-containing protein
VDHEAETRALLLLAQHLADSPDTILQKLTEIALELVDAGSSGVSLISPESGDFYWPAIAGAWSPHVGGGTPRNFGPCGIVLDHNAAQLFRNPGRYYRYLAPASPTLEEVLLIPFYVRGTAVGTVWAVSHDPARRFDAEDQRMLSSVATFAAAAFQTQQALVGMRTTERALRDAKQRLESTLSSNEVATWIWDVEEDRVLPDANLCRLFGVSEAAAESAPLDLYLQVIHPADRDAVSAAITRSLSTGGRYEIDYRIRRLDGITLWFAARGQPQYDAAGKAVRLAGVLVDISERKRVEALQTRRSAQLQRLADVLPRIYGAHDLAAVLKVGAAEVRHVLGAAHARATLDASGNSAQPLEETSASSADEDRTPDSTDARGTRSADVLAVPLIGREGARLGSLEVISEPGAVFSADDRAFLIQIGHLLAVAVDNQRLLRGLEDADRRKNEFLATLAHELRNPLAPLVSGVQLLKVDSPTPTDLVRIRSMMDRQLTHMVRLVDDLMDISRVSRGRVELRKEWSELSRIVQQAVETSRPQIEKHAHRLRIELAAEPLGVHGDRDRLAQVISNLLNNAAKYTDPGGQITLSVERAGEHAVVAVQDTGVGLSSEMLPLVFDLFSQAQSSIDKAQGGLGIGLSLAKSLVELHGGTISATSGGLGRGSRFSVGLPLAAKPTSVAVPSGASARTAPRRVLIADDNADAAAMLAELLTAHGHDVHIAHDGLAAVEAAIRLQPDAILLDLGMPRLDGYEAGRQIRELLARRPPLLVALTGWGLEEARSRTKTIGFDAHLVKPIDYAALLALLAR